MPLIIRTAITADIPAIQKIAHDTWPSTYGDIISMEQIHFMLDWMYSTASLEEQFNKGHAFFMAELDDVPHGFASISEEGDRLFKLNKLYVLPSTQKTGAGKALLQTAIDYAKGLGGKQLQLQVNRHNNAKNFYLKHGFTIIREFDFDIGNGYTMDDYVMELSL